MADALVLLRRLEQLLQRFQAAADAADPAQQVWGGRASGQARAPACSAGLAWRCLSTPSGCRRSPLDAALLAACCRCHPTGPAGRAGGRGGGAAPAPDRHRGAAGPAGEERAGGAAGTPRVQGGLLGSTCLPACLPCLPAWPQRARAADASGRPRALPLLPTPCSPRPCPRQPIATSPDIQAGADLLARIAGRPYAHAVVLEAHAGGWAGGARRGPRQGSLGSRAHMLLHICTPVRLERSPAACAAAPAPAASQAAPRAGRPAQARQLWRRRRRRLRLCGSPGPEAGAGPGRCCRRRGGGVWARRGRAGRGACGRRERRRARRAGGRLPFLGAAPDGAVRGGGSRGWGAVGPGSGGIARSPACSPAARQPQAGAEAWLASPPRPPLPPPAPPACAPQRLPPAAQERAAGVCGAGRPDRLRALRVCVWRTHGGAGDQPRPAAGAHGAARDVAAAGGGAWGCARPSPCLAG